MPTEELLKEALRDIYDPEIPVNIVDLGLLYGVALEGEHGEKAVITMTLTTPGCGMGGHISQEIKERLMLIPGVEEVQVSIVWEPAWNPDLISADAKEVLGI